jgi:hypothetical protein
MGAFRAGRNREPPRWVTVIVASKHVTGCIRSHKGTRMSVFNWLGGHFTNRGKALAVYRRGMKKARKHDHQGAIDDYTAVINTPGVSPDVKAMAHYNRALVHRATKNLATAIEDLNVILTMNVVMDNVNVKTMARQELIRIERLTARDSS